MIYQIELFMDVEPFLHSWNKSQLIVMCNSFNVLLKLVY